MPVETFGEGGFVLTGNSITQYRFLVLKRAMEFELRTGMKMSRVCPFKAVRHEFSIKERRKQKVYESFCALLEASGAGTAV